MILQFKITSESFKEFEASVASDPKNKVLDRLRSKVKKDFQEGIVYNIIGVSVSLGSCIDADFLLKSFVKEDRKAIFVYEFLGTSG